MWWFQKTKSNGESKKALEDSAHQLGKIRKRDAEVYKVTNSLKRMRERNHFAEQLEIIMAGYGGGPK